MIDRLCSAVLHEVSSNIVFGMAGSMNVLCEAVGSIKCIIKVDNDIDISSLDVISILLDSLISSLTLHMCKEGFWLMK